MVRMGGVIERFYEPDERREPTKQELFETITIANQIIAMGSRCAQLGVVLEDIYDVVLAKQKAIDTLIGGNMLEKGELIPSC